MATWASKTKKETKKKYNSKKKENKRLPNIGIKVSDAE